MTTLDIAQIVSRTTSEGPGARFALWVQGCTIRCPGCCNPEMFWKKGGTTTPITELLAQVFASETEGISVLGGEPFEQALGVAALARAVRGVGRSVMVYTGYTLEELEARGDSGVTQLLTTCDILVDGRFERDRLDTTRRFVGSTNQRMHFLTTRYSEDDPQFRAPNTAEIRFHKGVLSVHGWPKLAQGITTGFRGKVG